MKVLVFLAGFFATVHCSLWRGNPWIVTDSRIYDPAGVKPEFSYAEKKCTTFKCQISSEGCPKSIDGHPWVLLGSPPRCYLTGMEMCQGGPCKPGFTPAVSSKSKTMGECKKIPFFRSECCSNCASDSKDKHGCRNGWKYSDSLGRCLLAEFL